MRFSVMPRSNSTMGIRHYQQRPPSQSLLLPQSSFDPQGIPGQQPPRAGTTFEQTLNQLRILILGSMSTSPSQMDSAVPTASHGAEPPVNYQLQLQIFMTIFEKDRDNYIDVNGQGNLVIKNRRNVNNPGTVFKNLLLQRMPEHQQNVFLELISNSHHKDYLQHRPGRMASHTHFAQQQAPPLQVPPSLPMSPSSAMTSQPPLPLANSALGLSSHMPMSQQQQRGPAGQQMAIWNLQQQLMNQVAGSPQQLIDSRQNTRNFQGSNPRMFSMPAQNQNRITQNLGHGNRTQVISPQNIRPPPPGTRTTYHPRPQIISSSWMQAFQGQPEYSISSGMTSTNVQSTPSRQVYVPPLRIQFATTEQSPLNPRSDDHTQSEFRVNNPEDIQGSLPGQLDPPSNFEGSETASMPQAYSTAAPLQGRRPAPSSVVLDFRQTSTQPEETNDGSQAELDLNPLQIDGFGRIEDMVDFGCTGATRMMVLDQHTTFDSRITIEESEEEKMEAPRGGNINSVFVQEEQPESQPSLQIRTKNLLELEEEKVPDWPLDHQNQIEIYQCDFSSQKNLHSPEQHMLRGDFNDELILDSSTPKNKEIEIEKASPEQHNVPIPKKIFGDRKLKLKEDFLALDGEEYGVMKAEEMFEESPHDLSPEIKCDNVPSFLRNSRVPSNFTSTAKFQGENSAKHLLKSNHMATQDSIEDFSRQISGNSGALEQDKQRSELSGSSKVGSKKNGLKPSFQSFSEKLSKDNLRGILKKEQPMHKSIRHKDDSLLNLLENRQQSESQQSNDKGKKRNVRIQDHSSDEESKNYEGSLSAETHQEAAEISKEIKGVSGGLKKLRTNKRIKEDKVMMDQHGLLIARALTVHQKNQPLQSSSNQSSQKNEESIMVSHKQSSIERIGQKGEPELSSSGGNAHHSRSYYNQKNILNLSKKQSFAKSVMSIDTPDFIMDSASLGMRASKNEDILQNSQSNIDSTDPMRKGTKDSQRVQHLVLDTSKLSKKDRKFLQSAGPKTRFDDESSSQGLKQSTLQSPGVKSLALKVGLEKRKSSFESKESKPGDEPKKGSKLLEFFLKRLEEEESQQKEGANFEHILTKKVIKVQDKAMKPHDEEAVKNFEFIIDKIRKDLQKKIQNLEKIDGLEQYKQQVKEDKGEIDPQIDLNIQKQVLFDRNSQRRKTRMHNGESTYRNRKSTAFKQIQDLHREAKLSRCVSNEEEIFSKKLTLIKKESPNFSNQVMSGKEGCDPLKILESPRSSSNKQQLLGHEFSGDNIEPKFDGKKDTSGDRSSLIRISSFEQAINSSLIHASAKKSEEEKEEAVIPDNNIEYQPSSFMTDDTYTSSSAHSECRITNRGLPMIFVSKLEYKEPEKEVIKEEADMIMEDSSSSSSQTNSHRIKLPKRDTEPILPLKASSRKSLKLQQASEFHLNLKEATKNLQRKITGYSSNSDNSSSRGSKKREPPKLFQQIYNQLNSTGNASETNSRMSRGQTQNIQLARESTIHTYKNINNSLGRKTFTPNQPENTLQETMVQPPPCEGIDMLAVKKYHSSKSKKKKKKFSRAASGEPMARRKKRKIKPQGLGSSKEMTQTFRSKFEPASDISVRNEREFRLGIILLQNLIGQVIKPIDTDCRLKRVRSKDPSKKALSAQKIKEQQPKAGLFTSDELQLPEVLATGGKSERQDTTQGGSATDLLGIEEGGVNKEINISDQDSKQYRDTETDQTMVETIKLYKEQTYQGRNSENVVPSSDDKNPNLLNHYLMKQNTRGNVLSINTILEDKGEYELASSVCTTNVMLVNKSDLNKINRMSNYSQSNKNLYVKENNFSINPQHNAASSKNLLQQSPNSKAGEESPLVVFNKQHTSEFHMDTELSKRMLMKDKSSHYNRSIGPLESVSEVQLSKSSSRSNDDSSRKIGTPITSQFPMKSIHSGKHKEEGRPSSAMLKKKNFKQIHQKKQIVRDLEFGRQGQDGNETDLLSPASGDLSDSSQDLKQMLDDVIGPKTHSGKREKNRSKGDSAFHKGKFVDLKQTPDVLHTDDFPSSSKQSNQPSVIREQEQSSSADPFVQGSRADFFKMKEANVLTQDKPRIRTQINKPQGIEGPRKNSFFKLNYSITSAQEKTDGEEKAEDEEEEGLPEVKKPKVEQINPKAIKNQFVYVHDYKLPHKIMSKKGYSIFQGKNLIKAIRHVSKMLRIQNDSVMKKIFDEVLCHEIISSAPAKESPLPRRTEVSESPKTRKLLVGNEISKKKNSDMNVHRVGSDNGQLKVSCLDSEPATKEANFTRSNSRITPDIQSLSYLDVSHQDKFITQMVESYFPISPYKASETSHNLMSSKGKLSKLSNVSEQKSSSSMSILTKKSVLNSKHPHTSAMHKNLASKISAQRSDASDMMKHLKKKKLRRNISRTNQTMKIDQSTEEEVSRLESAQSPTPLVGLSKSPAPSGEPRLLLSQTKKRGSLNNQRLDGLLKTETEREDSLDSRQFHMTGTESLKKTMMTAKQKELDRSKFFMAQLEMQKIKSKSQKEINFGIDSQGEPSPSLLDRLKARRALDDVKSSQKSFEFLGINPNVSKISNQEFVMSDYPIHMQNEASDDDEEEEDEDEYYDEEEDEEEISSISKVEIIEIKSRHNSMYDEDGRDNVDYQRGIQFEEKSSISHYKVTQSTIDNIHFQNTITGASPQKQLMSPENKSVKNWIPLKNLELRKGNTSNEDFNQTSPRGKLSEHLMQKSFQLRARNSEKKDDSSPSSHLDFIPFKIDEARRQTQQNPKGQGLQEKKSSGWKEESENIQNVTKKLTGQIEGGENSGNNTGGLPTSGQSLRIATLDGQSPKNMPTVFPMLPLSPITEKQNPSEAPTPQQLTANDEIRGTSLTLSGHPPLKKQITTQNNDMSPVHQSSGHESLFKKNLTWKRFDLPQEEESCSSIDNDALSKMEDLRRAHRARMNLQPSTFAYKTEKPTEPSVESKASKPDFRPEPSVTISKMSMSSVSKQRESDPKIQPSPKGQPVVPVKIASQGPPLSIAKQESAQKDRLIPGVVSSIPRMTLKHQEQIQQIYDLSKDPTLMVGGQSADFARSHGKFPNQQSTVQSIRDSISNDLSQTKDERKKSEEWTSKQRKKPSAEQRKEQLKQLEALPNLNLASKPVSPVHQQQPAEKTPAHNFARAPLSPPKKQESEGTKDKTKVAKVSKDKRILFGSQKTVTQDFASVHRLLNNTPIPHLPDGNFLAPMNRSMQRGGSHTPKTSHKQISRFNPRRAMESSQSVSDTSVFSASSSRMGLLTQFTITTASCISKKANGKKQINQYVMLNLLGQGKFGKVKKVLDSSSREVFAMKIINKAKMRKRRMSPKKTQFTLIEKEVAIMKKMGHPYIVKLVEIIDDPSMDKQYLIMEFLHNGDLQKRIGQFEKKPLTEATLRKYFRQLLTAIWYCHEVVKIFHRDIKPENILLDKDDNIKLSDFGVSESFGDRKDTILFSNAGSDAYFAPECSKGSYDGKAADMWACAVTCYQIAFGVLPFHGKDRKTLTDNISTQEPSYNLNLLKLTERESIPDFYDLLKAMLKKDPAERPSLEDLQTHTWLTNGGKEEINWSSDVEYVELENWDLTEQQIAEEVTQKVEEKNVYFKRKQK